MSGIFGGSAGGSKASSFLSSLRREPGSGSGPQEDLVRPLMARIEMLERRLQDQAAQKEQQEQEEKEAKETAPQPPNELMVFLQTRVQLLEAKLQSAQEEALRAGLLLREREDAQRKAQAEVEQLFRSIREQTRAASYDGKLRDEFQASQRKIEELETKLQEMKLKSLPADDVLRCLENEEGRTELEKRLRAQIEKVKEMETPHPGPLPAGERGSLPPVPPILVEEGSVKGAQSSTSLETRAQRESVSVPTLIKEGPDDSTLAVMMGRMSDLEKQLQQAQDERDQEKARRILWEKDILAAISKEPAQWQRSGGAQLVVEAALEHLAQTFKERDAVAAEMTTIVKQIQQEPPDSPELPALRARLAFAQDKTQELQKALDKHMNLVQAWLKSGKH